MGINRCAGPSFLFEEGHGGGDQAGVPGPVACAGPVVIVGEIQSIAGLESFELAHNSSRELGAAAGGWGQGAWMIGLGVLFSTGRVAVNSYLSFFGVKGPGSGGKVSLVSGRYGIWAWQCRRQSRVLDFGVGWVFHCVGSDREVVVIIMAALRSMPVMMIAMIVEGRVVICIGPHVRSVFSKGRSMDAGFSKGEDGGSARTFSGEGDEDDARHAEFHNDQDWYSMEFAETHHLETTVFSVFRLYQSQKVTRYNFKGPTPLQSSLNWRGSS
ncbi:uncharacterized protein EV420DRAFT_1486230 [Desarmillaria tabescens]|uniref:Uncharacterized protein n=1 Tax=Armillaria tabescens TaxID=1929756 RepID=A0AA39MMS5_ARMTA|nr:uncharacterized protein EV420DRAFT_1486230 [Desarmillaria tabescens]KAK0439474.1 hypothetical protein EV420DRAFT_1486230 [Desarmillaria tabescens]